MESFEDWLEGVPALALRELAGGGYELRSLPLGQVRELVLSQPGLRDRAERSWRAESEAREGVARMDPRVVRDLKVRYGLVD